uniref:Hexosyltransferase n=1 Tax=Chlamydomonas euryale TaxID=1486919 RepID=A0A6U2CS89_9CHLO|mmetsp:Transcript_15104/g.44506  ORF Transcript_15104/g.44506 Transcript_15104/m.44506 type:complete len:385 (+) Transcript_15104:2770-3924(+)
MKLEDAMSPLDYARLTAHKREFQAAVSYALGIDSQRFIGNSVSTFSALMIMERRMLDKWAAYYNGGNIPLTGFLQGMVKLPWVFTHNNQSWEYDYMVKAAVLSANKIGTLQPHCIFKGSNESDIAVWLVNNGVGLIDHTPYWTSKFQEKYRLSHAQKNLDASHLFADVSSMLGTFARLDIPVIKELYQYTYILYTDTDVFFQLPFTLDTFGLPLPPSLAMAYERPEAFPYNAGVLLMNLPVMRKDHQDIIDTMLFSSQNNGFHYGRFGPGDQGVLNMFYEEDLKQHVLPEAFNAKIYKPLVKHVYIVHFQGPKPDDILDYLENGHCRFKDMCAEAVGYNACDYVLSWARLGVAASDDDVGHQVSDRVRIACAVWTRATEQCTKQ